MDFSIAKVWLAFLILVIASFEEPPSGSVLGPILFLIYINDLDDSITSNVLKFADDTKLFRKVNTDGDKQHLQNDLDRLVKWSE